MVETIRSPFSRVFLIENRAGPANAPVFEGQARAMGPTWDFGARTPIREPDPDRYGAFRIVDAIKAERGLPTLSIENRYAYQISTYLRIARIGCPLDLQIHFGKCQDPRDFNGGWDKILALDSVDLTRWAANELGALEQGQDAVVNETVDTDALDMYEIKRLVLSEFGGAEVIQRVVDIVICDSISCGACGISSDGCSTIFAIQIATGASPGLPAELIWSNDGGATLHQINITTLPTDEDPSALACVGTRLVVASNGDCSIHHALIADIIAGTQVWAENVAGLVCPAGAPNAMFSAGSAQTWIVGDGGYVYFYSDITGTPTVQSAGAATVQNLNAIHGVDDQNLVAVGALNAVIYTRNGGESWASVTGPAVGVALNTVWMKSENEWFVGTAGGRLYYTIDAGVTWTEKTFSGSGAGSVRDIVFSTNQVGYMAHSTAAAAGRIFRTIDGGFSWYVLPEGTGSIPANDYVGALAACAEDPNVVYGGGLGDNAVDGFLVKGS